MFVVANSKIFNLQHEFSLNYLLILPILIPSSTVVGTLFSPKNGLLLPEIF